jgi:hypothetical protein
LAAESGAGTSDFCLHAVQPDVIDGVLDGVEAGAFGEHPAGEDAPDLAVERDLIDLDERNRSLALRVVTA